MSSTAAAGKVIAMSDSKIKVAREVAESEFARMCEAFRIEHDASDLDEGEAAEFAALREPILRDIMRGIIVVGEDGNPTYAAPGSSKGVTFHPPTGATLMALNTYPDGKHVQNMAAAMADMTHVDKGHFGRMPLRDVQACMRLAKLFLADR